MSCHSNPMTCDHVPGSFSDSHHRLAHPLPRWTILPGDPVDLRRWLREKQTSEPGTKSITWPDEESA